MALTEIKTSGIADDAVTTDKLANAINTERTANTAKTSLENNAVTLAKMAGGTDGQIITYDANGDPIAIGPGTDGQVLTSTGAGSPPAFEALPASGPSLANDANNRVITGTGSGLNGEANLTFDGGALSQTIDAGDEGINITAAGNHNARFKIDSNRSGTNDTLFHISSRWNGTEVAGIHWRTGADTTNKDDGRLTFHTTPSGGSLTERLKITEDGKVGINETSPQQQLHVHDDTIYNGVLINGNGAPRLAFARSTTTTGEWSVGVDGTDGTQFAITNSNDNSNRKFVISSSLNTHNQNTQINGNLSFGTSGDGIDFSIASGSAAGSSSATLDDYEEGTFTPTCTGQSGSLTLSTAVGSYTKIGNVVYISYEIVASSGSTGTFPRLGGLPFTSSSSAAKTIIAAKDKVGVSYGSSYSDMYFRIDQNATTAVGIAERIDGTTHTGSNLDFTNTLRGSGFYFV